jgi:Flp pilus assembly protein TadG
MKRPRLSLRRFARDDRGVSAIEFAMIAPLLITFYLGMAETTQAMMAKRKAAHVASVVGDLVAQDQSVTPEEFTDLWTIGNALLTPFPTSGKLGIRVTSVTANSSGVVKVDWSCAGGTGLTAKAKASTWTGIPGGLIAAGQSLVIAETLYPYDSPIKKYVPNTLNFTDIYYLRPRKIATVQISSTCS